MDALMMLVLFVVIASQVATVGPQFATPARLIPLYAAFALIAIAVGWLASHLAKLNVPSTSAVIFSTATRNSLVLLLAPLAVITQTLVELIFMVVMVTFVPRVVK